MNMFIYVDSISGMVYKKLVKIIAPVTGGLKAGRRHICIRYVLNFIPYTYATYSKDKLKIMLFKGHVTGCFP